MYFVNQFEEILLNELLLFVIINCCLHSFSLGYEDNIYFTAIITRPRFFAQTKIDSHGLRVFKYKQRKYAYICCNNINKPFLHQFHNSNKFILESTFLFVPRSYRPVRSSNCCLLVNMDQRKTKGKHERLFIQPLFTICLSVQIIGYGKQSAFRV